MGPSAARPPARRPLGARLLAVGALVVSAIAVAVALASFTSPTRAALVAVHAPAADGRTVRALPRRRDATLPFAPQPGDRAARPGEVPSFYDDGLSCSTGCRPYGAQLGWPLKPFHAQHPLRAGLNELRPGSLHVGVDIQAPDGSAVYAVQSGMADVLESSGPNARVQVGNYVYWHIDPTVVTGQPVTAFVTELGTVMRGYGHLAFSELGWRNTYVNPLRPGGSVLAPYVNTDPPVIARPVVAAGGQVIVAAYSPQSFVRRTTYATPVLAPAALAYRLSTPDGVEVTPLQWAFRGTHLLSWSERALIYAPGAGAPGYDCFATRSVCVPHWVYRLAGGLTPPLPFAIASGQYRLTIYAWDWADNVTALDTTLTMTATGWRPIGHFPVSLYTAPGYFTAGPGSLPEIWSAKRRGNPTITVQANGQCCSSSASSSPSGSPIP